MSRRDTIILAVLLNTGLLAILFVLAINPDEDVIVNHVDISNLVAEAPRREEIQQQQQPIILSLESKTDEVDNVLKDFAESICSSPEEIANVGYFQPKEVPIPISTSATVKPQVDDISNQSDFVEITVKSGDILGRIAQANNTTITAIKRLNNLVNDRLRVGQVLKIPLGSKQPGISAANSNKMLQNNSFTKFYIIQSGDTPWKIAKKFSVSVQELLSLNALDEKKARSLKPGDRIRVQ